MISQPKRCQGNYKKGIIIIICLEFTTHCRHLSACWFPYTFISLGANWHACNFNIITLWFVSISDVANVIQACYGETPPPIILIGHGVGGAIAVHTASNMLLPTTVGLVAIDVVEGEQGPEKHNEAQFSARTLTEVTRVFFSLGSAMEALHSIQNFLKGRPKSFKSVDHAIEWRFAFRLLYTLSSKDDICLIIYFVDTQCSQMSMNLSCLRYLPATVHIDETRSFTKNAELQKCKYGKVHASLV